MQIQLTKFLRFDKDTAHYTPLDLKEMSPEYLLGLDGDVGSVQQFLNLFRDNHFHVRMLSD